MKLNTKEFLAAVKTVTALKGGTFPAANLVRFGNGKLTRTTSEAHSEVTLAGSDEDILLDGEWLKRIQPPGETLEITTDENGHTLKSGNLTAFRLKTKDEPIPQPTPQGSGVTLTIPPEAIKAALAAASHDGGRPALQGVILDGNKDNLLVIGSDGRRMHITDLGTSDLKRAVSIGSVLAVLIPDGANITVFDNCFVVEGEGQRLILSMPNDLPPNCRQIIPTKFDGFATISGQDLRDAMGRMKLLHAGQAIRMEFTKGTLTLSYSDKEVGSSEISLPCKTKGANPFGMNEAYLSSALSLCGDEITLNSYDPCGLSIKHNNLTLIIMGFRLE